MTFTLPGRYEYLTKRNRITYKARNLRTIYLLHLIDHFIKAYDNFASSVPLYSKVLKQVYGNHYAAYVDYLTETGFMKKVKCHSSGNHTSTLYKLTDDLSCVMTFKSYDYILSKKLDKYRSSQNPLKLISPIPREIRQKLIDDLQSVTIDFDKSISYLNENIDNDPIKYTKNLSMINKIQDGDLFHIFDDWGRFHTNFTNLKKDIRNEYMMIDGQPVGSFDIKSSQPFFLSQLLRCDPLVTKNDELLKFIEILEDKNQDIYIYFVDRYPEIFNHSNPKVNRDRSKNYVIKAMYDVKNKNTKYKLLFGNAFPSIVDFMENYKRNEGHELWSSLQRLESEFIFKKVYMSIKNQYPDIKIITVHDAIYFPIQYYDSIKQIWDKHRQDMIRKK